jgi:hypothetical protein
MHEQGKIGMLSSDTSLSYVNVSNSAACMHLELFVVSVCCYCVMDRGSREKALVRSVYIPKSLRVLSVPDPQPLHDHQLI